MNRVLIAALATVLSSSACTSPEATRTQGGGRGADTGNRGAVVLMHEGSRPYEDTPRLIPAKAPPVDPANHADALSRQRLR